MRDSANAVSNTGTVTVTVTCVNDAPTAVNDSATTNEDTATTISVLTNDTDPDTSDTKNINAFTQPANGTTTLAGSGITFTPVANFCGSTTFTYTMRDSANAVSNTGTVTVTVTCVNDAPTAVNDSATTNEDTATTISVLTNDTDPDSGNVLFIDSFTLPSRGITSVS
jgi:hypothetical protein